jgi:hypothetical protein
VKGLVGISKSYTFENKNLKVEVGRFHVNKASNVNKFPTVCSDLGCSEQMKKLRFALWTKS